MASMAAIDREAPTTQQCSIAVLCTQGSVSRGGTNHDHHRSSIVMPQSSTCGAVGLLGLLFIPCRAVSEHGDYRLSPFGWSHRGEWSMRLTHHVTALSVALPPPAQPEPPHSPDKQQIAFTTFLRTRWSKRHASAISSLPSRTALSRHTMHAHTPATLRTSRSAKPWPTRPHRPGTVGPSTCGTVQTSRPGTRPQSTGW